MADSRRMLLDLKGIKKSYHLGGNVVPALRGIDLEVGHGDFMALMGPSGSGKSTLLNLCGLLDVPDEGTIHLDDGEVGRLPERARTLIRRQRVGFVFQGFNLVPVLTVHDNVEYPLLLSSMPSAEREERIAWILGRTGLTRFGHHLPDQLSGGQRQRVAIARALVKRPELVIADEPTANLDTTTATEIIDLMHELANEASTTFVIATHDERMAKRCARVIHVQDGIILP
jgi:putative ABC transport system ATP-binding protein